MMTRPMRGGLRHRLARFLLVGAGTVAAPASARADTPTASHDDVSSSDDDSDTTCDDDVIDAELASFVGATEGVNAAACLGALLEHMHPFDATRTAALAALSRHTFVRHALAQALASRMRIVGAAVMLEHLEADVDPRVRDAASRAASVRFAGTR